MRQVIDPQIQLGELDIGSIRIDPRSRDDIPQILLGLQHIYTTVEVRERVFAILEEVRPEKADGEAGEKAAADNGRPGMNQWQIFVLGVLRLGLNADYDRIQELANQHNTIRQMLGHSDWADDKHYSLQTLRDNLRLFTLELLDRINQEVVRAGHQALKKSPEEGLAGRCDSFVVETDVHFPTDINLLLDAIRVILRDGTTLAEAYGIPGWRQHAYHQRQFKKQYRKTQRLKHSTSKDEQKKKRKQQEIQAAHRAYIEQAQVHIERAVLLAQQLQGQGALVHGQLAHLEAFIQHALRQIDQIDRRVLKGEAIPHAEKVFSLFQPHTEWISKGKAGVPVELGLRVCILDDRHGFILHHRVMERSTDDQIAVTMVDEGQQRFPALRAVSFDKGFHSPANQQALKERLDCTVLPKKGRLSKADRQRESEPEFVELRKQHSAVESSINALEAHGLDICRDHGIVGFKRYTALAVVARNIHHLGAILRQQQQEQEARKRRKRRAKA